MWGTSKSVNSEQGAILRLQILQDYDDSSACHAYSSGDADELSL
jgi:hypothetical protein